MSTLPIHAPRVPSVNVPGFARVAAYVMTVIDVFTEAQALAAAAHRRYPFADW